MEFPRDSGASKVSTAAPPCHQTLRAQMVQVKGEGDGTRRHLRRCPVKGQAFVDWFKQQGNAFDTQALKQYGWLKMNAFIDGCLHVVPSSGQQFPFTDHFKGAVVLETIDFSVSDLNRFGKDDPIPHGLLQVTVMPATLQKNCN